MDCYAMVRGVVIRATRLNARGQLDSRRIERVTTKGVATVGFDPVVESGSNELLRTDAEEPLLRWTTRGHTIRYTTQMQFVGTDPALMNLLTSTPMVKNAAGDYVGFDAATRLPLAAFALEIWTRLDRTCDGKREWGYTLAPFLKGGIATGFSFDNGALSFGVKDAMTRRQPGWVVGPYDITGPWQRLEQPVSRNTAWRNIITTWEPPQPVSGIQVSADILDGGGVAGVSSSADALPFTLPHTFGTGNASDVIDGGTPASNGPWIIDGGTP